MSSTTIEGAFPNLSSANYSITSDVDGNYHCIAWAAGRASQWWDPTPYPGYYWPKGIQRSDTIDRLISVFNQLGYTDCGLDDTLENGFEKVAIYGDSGVYEHACKQLDNGTWTSKLGSDEDISHDNLDSLTGDLYGQVVCILKRKTQVILKANENPPK